MKEKVTIDMETAVGCVTEVGERTGTSGTIWKRKYKTGICSNAIVTITWLQEFLERIEMY